MGKLVFDRKAGESVMVGEDLQVVVMKITPTKVVLGFMAPDSVKIHRTEVWTRMRAERAEKPARKAS